MIRSQKQRVRATVAYADIFAYPLTRDEISLWGIGRVPRRFPLPRGLKEKHGYVVSPGREKSISLREARYRVADPKWKSIGRVVRVLSLIPTVEFVGVTGGLAMDNADIHDDIDLFFIAHEGTLWATRGMVTVLAECMHVRRHPHDTVVSDKVCLNMFMAEDALSLPRVEQDLFVAHEILQMKPVWDRGGMHVRMLEANRWASYFLPNAWKAYRESSRRNAHVYADSLFRKFLCVLIGVCEGTFKGMQLQYMKNKRTTEVIRSGMIRFHPNDARVWIRKKLEDRLARFDIPIDKIFYHR